MFAVIREASEHVPTAICDNCGQIIDAAKRGNYARNPQADGAPEMLTVHKQCMWHFERSNHTVCWYKSGLDVLPIYMENAWSVDREEALRQAKMLARF